MGTNFADGKGNITAWLSYFHTDPVSGAQRDFSACQVTEIQPQQTTVTGATCGGSHNSNFFAPFGSTGQPYSVVGNQLVPQSQVPPGTSPPVSFNSQPDIYMTRGDTRDVAGFRAHEDLQDWLRPYM
jgi:hypothetical protein